MHALPRSLKRHHAIVVPCCKFILSTLLTLSSPANRLSASPSQPIHVPMSPESFVVSNPNGASATGPQFLDYLGRKAVYLPSGLLNVKGSKLRDGIIDV